MDDSSDFAAHFSKLPLDTQQIILCGALNKLSVEEFSQLVRNEKTPIHLLQPQNTLDYKGNYFQNTLDCEENYPQKTPNRKDVQSQQTPDKSGFYISPEKGNPVILYESIRQSTPAKPRRSKPSKRYRSRRKQRSIRAARYDFKSGKIVDVSLTSVGSETPSYLNSASSYSQNMSSLPEEYFDDNVFHSGPNTTFQAGPDTTFDVDPDTTFQEVLRHRRPPSEAHRFFRTVFASPISRKVEEEPRTKEAGTSTTDLTFSCTSCSCVRCPQTVCYPSQQSVQVEVVANLPVCETDSGKSLSKNQISSLYPMELSKSPYSRPTRHHVNQPHKTSATPTSLDQDKTAGECTSIESFKENLPSHNTASFHNQVDKFLTELDQLRFSNMELEVLEQLRLSKLELEEQEVTSPVSPVQVRTRLFQTNRKTAPGNRLAGGRGARGILHVFIVRLCSACRLYNLNCSKGFCCCFC